MMMYIAQAVEVQFASLIGVATVDIRFQVRAGVIANGTYGAIKSSRIAGRSCARHQLTGVGQRWSHAGVERQAHHAFDEHVHHKSSAMALAARVDAEQGVRAG